MNVLIYGLGSIARKHIAQLQLLIPDKLHIYALRSGSGDKTAVDSVVNIYDESELEAALDFIIISNPTYLRAQTLRRALQFGKPLFIEKPSLFTLDAAIEISAALGSSNSLSYVACNLRFHPCLLFFKKKLAEGIGKVEEVNIYCGSYLPSWRDMDFRKSYSSDAAMGGGVHLDLIHELDYCVWLFGKPQTAFSCKRSTSHLRITAVDYANFLLEYENFAASITLNYFRQNKKRTIELVTSEGTWQADLFGNKIFFNDVEYCAFPYFNIMDTYKDQLLYFINHMHNGTQPMNSFDESLEVLKIALS